MNNSPPILQGTINSARDPKYRILINQVQCDMFMVVRKKMSLQEGQRPWITTALDEMTNCPLGSIVTSHPPTADDISSLVRDSIVKVSRRKR